MRVLWVVGFMLPAVAEAVGARRIPFGGWVGAMLGQLSDVQNLNLGVVMKADVAQRSKIRLGNVDYYLLPQKRRNRFDVSPEDCKFVLSDFGPDLLHAEGTEQAYTRRFLESWQGHNVVSLQGIINAYEPYEYGGLPLGRMLCSGHPHKVLPALAMMVNKKLRFEPRLKEEIATLKLAQNFLGRTTWDRAHARAINSDAPYFSCNRILRSPFYHSAWSLDKAQRHSVFIGNAASARKGAHFVIHALAQLVKDFPDITLNIAGDVPTVNSWRDWKKMVGYSAYLRHLVKELDVANHVNFLGEQQAEAMAAHLRKSHVFVLPSVIENSPNTLGEAMLLGVPSVSAYAGGAPDMAADGREALFYRDNDPQLLAWQIRRIFTDDGLAITLSGNARKRASMTHEPARNRDALLECYRTILQKP